MYKKIEKYCKKSKTCIIQKSLSLPPLKSQKEKKNLKIIRHKNRNNEEKTEKINNGRILLQIEIFFGKQKQRKTNHNSMEFKKKNFLMKKKIRKKGEEKKFKNERSDGLNLTFESFIAKLKSFKDFMKLFSNFPR